MLYELVVQPYVVSCEISPLVSYAGENLTKYRGRELRLPVLLQ